MKDLESLTAALVKQGFFPHLRGNETGWRCELATASLKTMPMGIGKTALEALIGAMENRQRLEADPRFKQV